MNVTVTRHTNRYKRSVNGAWLSAGSDSAILEADDQDLPKYSLDSGLTVAYPDGVTEHVFPSRAGFGYPADCIPRDGRLAQIFKAAGK